MATLSSIAKAVGSKNISAKAKADELKKKKVLPTITPPKRRSETYQEQIDISQAVKDARNNNLLSADKTQPVVKTENKKLTDEQKIALGIDPKYASMEEQQADAANIAQVEASDAAIKESALGVVGQDYTDESAYVNKLSKDLGLDIGNVPSTMELKIDQIKQDQADEMYYQQEQARLAAEAEAIARQRQIEQSEAAKASNTAQFAQGREGVYSTGADQAKNKLNDIIQGRVDEAGSRLQAAHLQRSRALAQLEKAQQSDNEQLIRNLSNQVAKAEQDIREAEIAQANAQHVAAQDALAVQEQNSKNVTKAFDVFEKAPGGSFADMTPELIAESFDIDMGAASMIKALDAKKATIDTTTPEGKIQQAAVNKAIAEAKVAGMTQDEKNYAFYKTLLASDPNSALAYAQKNGFADSPNAQEALENQLEWDKYANDYYTENGIWPSRGGQTTPSGSVENTDSVGEWGGQCGYYTNEYYGAKLFGNSLNNKLEYNNSDVPVTGGAFISKYGLEIEGIGNTGHVGIVTKVYPDGSFDIQDSNRHGDETIDTAHVSNPTEYGIVGYFNPSQAAAGWSPSADYAPPALPSKQEYLASTGASYLDPTQGGIGKQLTEKDAILAQMKAGNMTNTEVTKNRNKARNQGWLDEFTAIQNSPKIKPITIADSTKYNVPAAITQYQLDEILAYREQQGLGNRQFQAYVNDTATDAGGTSEHDKLVKFIQLRENLQEAKDLYEEFTEVENGGLSGWWDKTGRTFARLGTWIGTEPTKELELYKKIQALTGDALVNYVKETSGVAVSEQEFERLKQYKPNVDMPDYQFKDQLDRMIKEYDASAQAKLKRFGFTDKKQMEDVIMGRTLMPQTVPGTPQPQIEQPTYTLPD